MSNYQQVKGELQNYIMARTPLIIVNTSERERVERMLAELVREQQFEILYYTDAKQVRNLYHGGAALDTDGDPLEFFLRAVKKQRGITVALGDVKRVSDDNFYSREILNILYTAKENTGVVILVTPDPVWTRLSYFGMVTTLDLPDMGERICQIEQFIYQYGGRFEIDWEKEDIRRAATVLRGFSEIQIDNILSTEIIGCKGLKRKRIHSLAEQKRKLYSQVPSVQYIDISVPRQVSGMDNLKQWLSEKKQIFFMPEEILSQYELTAPKGILLVGVPGCGKSLSAKLIAQEWELPLFRFDIGSVFDKWVGESEKKMREALQFIEHISPCILWIDEIEKVLATSESGNETGKRVLGEFLFWLQESRSRVFMVATANDVSALPYELYRKGRFTEIFYAGLPGKKERREALCQYMRRSLRLQPGENLLDELVQITDRYSYSDIENAVKDVAQHMLANGRETLPAQELTAAIRRIIPITKMNPELVASIEAWGAKRAVNVSSQQEVEHE